MSHDQAKAWAEQVVIPTYGIAAPDKNPMFIEKRVYQGSSGAVYPYPVIDRVFDEKEDKTYTAIFLENRYLKIMVLPEIGGRVQMALDKTNNYHFVYYNRVIKPALVGLTGPWISGGIEFNWPQHHRPTTFMPMDWRIDEGEDGSVTVWCAEIEPMYGTKGMHGFRLYPDRAYLEILVQLYNRTSEPQTFLWWANPAVHVNDDYQSIFPPDVHAVMDHGKRDVSSFPIATGVYYKKDYSPGTDISRYKNIPVPTSYMAYHSDFDFVGCYDHGRQAGMMHVANHHVVPGKKQWTWGNSDFGLAWDRQLTDEDGPYIELMCGAFTDNQPDFSWLQPGEEKRFSQIFMPYKLIGGAKNASKDAVINLEIADGNAQIGVYTTSRRAVEVRLRRGEQVLFSQAAELSPETALNESVALPAGIVPQELTLEVLADQQVLLDFTPLPDERPEIPAPATPAKHPSEIASNEELFLNGLHLEQYRHATFAPEPYYEEALRRDPLDSRCNNALGLLLLRRGKFAEAESYFRTAIKSLTRRNPNPYDGEPFYNLGQALFFQGRFREATDAYYKSVWNAAWQDAGYYALARLASRAGDYAEAIDLTERALRRNWSHHKARHLKAALLRRLGRIEEARRELAIALELDRLEFGALAELSLLDNDLQFDRYTKANPSIACEIAIDYGHAGLWEEAQAFFQRAPQSDPMSHYFSGWFYLQAGDQEAAEQAFAKAQAQKPDYCFPNRLETVPALEAAQRVNPNDPRAPFYLGNFWYAHRRSEEAIAAWERARELDDSLATVHRNLGLAYFNKLKDAQKAHASYQRAFACDPSDARVFFELDQLDKKLNRGLQERLSNLEAHLDLVEQRDDLFIERVNLYNLLGRHEEALQLLMGRKFHPWEGGEGKASGQYIASLVQLAKQAIEQGQFEKAIELLERAQVYPHNLGEGKLAGAQENHIFYYLGRAYEGLGQQEQARHFFQRATVGQSEPTSAMYYNDQPPDMIFYQGLAHRALGNEAAAEAVFNKLVAYGQQHYDDDVKIDYFAVSLPDFLVFEGDLNQHNKIHCDYMQGLGYLGLGDKQRAEAHFNKALAADANHLGATLHRRLLVTL